MNKILTTKQAITLSTQLHKQNQKVVLVGGCFDLLHIGHITFLEEAKKKGDILIVLLESDTSITTAKGENRPINSQDIRAKILAALSMVDRVILLEPQMSNTDYDTLVFAIKPAIIATTKGDPRRKEKEYCAQAVGAQVMDVIERQEDASTTHLAKLLQKDI